MSPSPDFPTYAPPKVPSRRVMSRGWLMTAIAFVIATVLIVIGSVAFFIMYDGFNVGYDEYIDDYEILDVIEPACNRMTNAVEGLTVSGTPAEQAAVIEKQNEAVSRMLVTIRELPVDLLDADKPTLKWLLDWEALLQARSTYAAEVERGNEPDLEIPLDPDGYEIIERMDWAGEPECVVPDALLDPYPVEVDEA